MGKKKVVIVDYEFPDVAEERRIAAEVGADLSVHNTTDPPEVLEVTAGADVVFSLYSKLTHDVLAGLADGATAIRYGMGYDNIDVAAATKLGVRVCNVPDYGADTVADHTVMLALACLRRLAEFQNALRSPAEGWITASEVGPVVSMGDAVYGLIGTGQIGRQVAKRVQAFGATVIAYDPYADVATMAEQGIRIVDLDELVSTSDIVSIHAPLTDETRYIVNAGRIAQMKDTAIIVNTARGALVDTLAAAQAVSDGLIGGLALDVFETEPLEPDHPLRSSPHTLLTPHAAYYSERALHNLQLFAAEEMGRAVRGEPLRCQVNRES